MPRPYVMTHHSQWRSRADRRVYCEYALHGEIIQRRIISNQSGSQLWSECCRYQATFLGSQSFRCRAGRDDSLIHDNNHLGPLRIPLRGGEGKSPLGRQRDYLDSNIQLALQGLFKRPSSHPQSIGITQNLAGGMPRHSDGHLRCDLVGLWGSDVVCAYRLSWRRCWRRQSRHESIHTPRNKPFVANTVRRIHVLRARGTSSGAVRAGPWRRLHPWTVQTRLGDSEPSDRLTTGVWKPCTLEVRWR
mmetsp:Transcript_30181/g.77915  ORF Transcript_30181/g.77915 Transcript_30181/m.77915 type:complete len:246 (+) Transcript_30181:1911-2648(+)